MTNEKNEHRVDIFDRAFELINLFYQQNYKAYLVGGCVRDLLIGEPITDINDVDMTSNATSEQIIALANFNNLKWFQEGHNGRAYGTVTIIYDNIPIQVTPFRTDENFKGRHCDTRPAKTLKEDLRRRDFTINAIALDRDGYPIDCFCGITDIMKGRIRSIEEPEITYKRDKLRVLRAIRIATETGFEIEKMTYEAIKYVDLNEVNTADGLCSYLILSKERIRDELIKILKSANRLRGLTLLDDTGLLKQIIPEIQSLKGTTQDERYHPEKDVFIHTQLSIKSLLPNSSLELVLATLLHDIAKPSTRIIDGDEIHFYEHEIIGARLSKEILYRLKFKAKTIEKVKWLIENHMRVHHFSEMKKSKKIELVEHEYFNDLVELLRADILGSSGINKIPEDLTEISIISEFLKSYEKELKERPVIKEKLINGYDVMNLGVSEKQGILIGQILEKVNDEIVEGRINTREEALYYIKELIKE